MVFVVSLKQVEEEEEVFQSNIDPSMIVDPLSKEIAVTDKDLLPIDAKSVKSVESKGESWYFLACTKPYYFDVADDSRVCYVEKDFLSKVICKKLRDEVHCLHYNVSK